MADRAEPSRIRPVAGSERGLAAIDLTERADRYSSDALIIGVEPDFWPGYLPDSPLNYDFGNAAVQNF